MTDEKRERFSIAKEFEPTGKLRLACADALRKYLANHPWDAYCYVVQIGAYPCINGVVLDLTVSLFDENSPIDSRFDAMVRFKCDDTMECLADPRLIAIIPLQCGWENGPFFIVDRTEDEMDPPAFWDILPTWMKDLAATRQVLSKVLNGIEALGASLCSFHEDRYTLGATNINFAVSFGDDTTLSCSLNRMQETLAFGRDSSRFSADDYRDVDSALKAMADTVGESSGTTARGGERLS